MPKTTDDHSLSRRILDEGPLRLSELSRILPDHPGYDQLHRYVKYGVKGVGGKVIRLEVVRIGTLRTSVKAYERFVEQLNKMETYDGEQ